MFLILGVLEKEQKIEDLSGTGLFFPICIEQSLRVVQWRVSTPEAPHPQTARNKLEDPHIAANRIAKIPIQQPINCIEGFLSFTIRLLTLKTTSD